MELTGMFRPQTLPAIDARQPSTRNRQAATPRISHQWPVPADVTGRLPHQQWHQCRDNSQRRVCQGAHTTTLRCKLRARRLGLFRRRALPKDAVWKLRWATSRMEHVIGGRRYRPESHDIRQGR